MIAANGASFSTTKRRIAGPLQLKELGSVSARGPVTPLALWGAAIGPTWAGTRPSSAQHNGHCTKVPERYQQVQTGASSVWRCRNRSCHSEILVKQLCPVDLDGGLHCSVCGSSMKRLHADYWKRVRGNTDEGQPELQPRTETDPRKGRQPGRRR